MLFMVENILKKENISFSKIEKASSGFTNLVYYVDDDLVIKISKDVNTEKKLEKEISIYRNIHLPYIPKFIAGRKFQNVTYLIISKLKGQSLFSIWHLLTKQQRNNCIKEIAQILKTFNNQNGEFLNDEYKLTDWQKFIKQQLSTRLDDLTAMGFDTHKIKDFLDRDMDGLFESNFYGLVYNDAHFDNFILDEKLSLVDFDRVIYAPIDYEMLIFKTMCDNPSKFASEADEPKVSDFDYVEIYPQLKKYYPEMFKIPNVEKRIAVYQFNYLAEQAVKIKDKAWINNLISVFEEQI